MTTPITEADLAEWDLEADLAEKASNTDLVYLNPDSVRELTAAIRAAWARIAELEAKVETLKDSL